MPYEFTILWNNQKLSPKRHQTSPLYGTCFFRLFQERIKAWQHWQSATAALTKKREAKAKAELQGRQDRVAVLREEIVDQERQQDMAQENFKTISRLIKKEVEQFDLRKAQDFKRGIIGYLQVMLKSQEDISKHWEQYLPEIKQISHNWWFL